MPARWPKLLILLLLLVVLVPQLMHQRPLRPVQRGAPGPSCSEGQGIFTWQIKKSRKCVEMDSPEKEDLCSVFALKEKRRRTFRRQDVCENVYACVCVPSP